MDTQAVPTGERKEERHWTSPGKNCIGQPMEGVSTMDPPCKSKWGFDT